MAPEGDLLLRPCRALSVLSNLPRACALGSAAARFQRAPYKQTGCAKAAHIQPRSGRTDQPRAQALGMLVMDIEAL